MSKIINFNEAKEFITQEMLFQEVNSYDIFRYYLPTLEDYDNLQLGIKISSPFRKDKNPSFSIFYSFVHSMYLFKDFATGESGSAIRFVQKLFEGFSYWESLSQIAVDFGISDKFVCASVLKSKQIAPIETLRIMTSKKHEPALLNIKFRPWNTTDLAYWKSYGITLPTLRRFRVLPITHYFLYGRKHNAQPYAYAFIEKKDGRMSFKIYQPFAEKLYKWRTNHSSSAHQGYYQLPKKGNLLIITKSLKDVMSLYEVAKISAIGIQCETYTLKESVMNEYKRRFENVLVLFDNDETGIRAAETYRSVFKIPSIVIPKKFYQVKDFSDLIKASSEITARKTLYSLVNIIYDKWLPF